MTYTGSEIIDSEELIGMSVEQLSSHYHILLGARYGGEIPKNMKVVPRFKDDLIARIMDIRTELANKIQFQKLEGQIK